MLQCVRMGEVFCGLHVAHVHIICPVRDVTHVRKCTRPSPAFPYCKRRKAGRGPGNEANDSQLASAEVQETGFKEFSTELRKGWPPADPSWQCYYMLRTTTKLSVLFQVLGLGKL